MYEEHFRIKGRPFPVHAGGAALYKGRQQERVLAGLRKALAWPDAVVALTGPVGSGKSVLVDHVLESAGKNRAVARIARLPLARDELLELLLTEFGISDPPAGRIQRFASFRRLLAGWAQANTRVFVVVEDALYLGTEALVELESLTAADAGGTAGVQLLLMGPPELREALQHRELARLRQRMRLRERLLPMEITDTGAYLKHAFGCIGANVDEVLEPAAIDTLQRYSEGIPRLINNLCEAAMTAATECSSARVRPALIEQVAVEQFGLEPTAATRAVEPGPAAKPAGEAMPDLIQDTLPGIASLQEPAAPKPAPWQAEADRMRALRSKTEHTEPALPALDEDGKPRAPMPAAAAAPKPVPTRPAAGGPPSRPAPELPRRPAAAIPPRPAAAIPPRPAAAGSPRTAPAVTPRPLPVTPSRPAAAKPLPATHGPAPGFDPSLLEPRAPEKLSKQSGPQDTQSVQALEQALLPDTQLLRALEEPAALIEDTAPVPLGLQQDMQATGRVPTEKLPTLSDSMRLDHRKPPLAAALDPASRAGKTAEPIPEITLDRKLDEHKQEAAERIAAEAAKRAAIAAAGPPAAPVDAEPASEPDTPAPLAPARTEKAPAPAAQPERADPHEDRLNKAAADLGSATSIEELDGMAAETLFGEEFSQIAAAVASMAPPGLDDGEPSPQPAPQPVAAPEPRPEASRPDPAANGAAAPMQVPAPPKAPTATPRSPAAAQNPTKPKPAAKAPPPADIDASASRRLEMVRALNGQKGIQIPSSAEQIVLEGTGPHNVAAAPKAAPGPKDRPIDNQFGSSMTQTLAALNPRKPPAPEVAAGVPATAPPPVKRGPKPEPIENQFGLSMTQTLKALSARSMNTTDDDGDDDEFDDDDDEPKGGFFSRFRRS